MSWKDELQVCDLDPDQLLEFRCMKCSFIYHTNGQEIMDRNYRDKWLSEIEKNKRCSSCGGDVHLETYHNNMNSGFCWWVGLKDRVTLFAS